MQHCSVVVVFVAVAGTANTFRLLFLNLKGAQTHIHTQTQTQKIFSQDNQRTATEKPGLPKNPSVRQRSTLVTEQTVCCAAREMYLRYFKRELKSDRKYKRVGR